MQEVQFSFKVVAYVLKCISILQAKVKRSADIACHQWTLPMQKIAGSDLLRYRVSKTEELKIGRHNLGCM